MPVAVAPEFVLRIVEVNQGDRRLRRRPRAPQRPFSLRPPPRGRSRPRTRGPCPRRPSPRRAARPPRDPRTSSRAGYRRRQSSRPQVRPPPWLRAMPAARSLARPRPSTSRSMPFSSPSPPWLPACTTTRSTPSAPAAASSWARASTESSRCSLLVEARFIRYFACATTGEMPSSRLPSTKVSASWRRLGSSPGLRVGDEDLDSLAPELARGPNGPGEPAGGRKVPSYSVRPLWHGEDSTVLRRPSLGEI